MYDTPPYDMINQQHDICSMQLRNTDPSDAVQLVELRKEVAPTHSTQSS